MKKAEDIYNKYKNLNEALEAIRTTLNKSETTVLIEPGIWEKGENTIVDNKVFDGKNEVSKKRNFPYTAVVGQFVSAPEDYRDVKSAVEADYQNELDAQWTANLRKKYKVGINKSVIKSIK